MTQKAEEILELPIEKEATVLHLHHLLKQKYRNFLDSTHLAIAVNETYSDSKTKLKEGDTICFIPPVSGG